MTLVAYLHGIGIVVNALNGSVGIVEVAVAVEEGVEVAVLCTVLIGYIKAELAYVVADTARNTVGGLPVDIVGRRGVVRAFGGDGSVLIAVLLEEWRHVVVAKAYGQHWVWFELEAKLYGAHPL